MNQIINLLNGDAIFSDDVTFDRRSYQFWSFDGDNLTDQIARKDKEAIWPDFDPARDNERLYQTAHPGKPATGSTSTLGLFVNQIVTDPFAAPLEAADRVVKNTVKAAFGSVFAWLAVGGIIFYFVNRKK